VAGRGTTATIALERAKIPFTLHEYAHDPRNESYGTEAAACGGKKAAMAQVAAAERATGYVAGGISPVGQRKRLPVVVDASAMGFTTVFCSAGRRGLEIELAPADLVRAASATVADISRLQG
jgi:Cys-tRNA(Pro)/Cys-tRNA(Cys) deacylase